MSATFAPLEMTSALPQASGLSPWMNFEALIRGSNPDTSAEEAPRPSGPPFRLEPTRARFSKAGVPGDDLKQTWRLWQAASVSPSASVVAKADWSAFYECQVAPKQQGLDSYTLWPTSNADSHRSPSGFTVAPAGWSSWLIWQYHPVPCRVFSSNRPGNAIRDALFLAWSANAQWLHAVDEGTDVEEVLLLEIAARFARHKEVQAVYSQGYRDETQVIVPIDTARFDSELMDRLLDDEYEIRRRALTTFLSFSYPPVGVISRREVVHPDARLLYIR